MLVWLQLRALRFPVSHVAEIRCGAIGPPTGDASAGVSWLVSDRNNAHSDKPFLKVSFGR